MENKKYFIFPIIDTSSKIISHTPPNNYILSTLYHCFNKHFTYIDTITSVILVQFFF